YFGSYYKSTDGGTSWITLSAPSDVNDIWVQSDGTVFIATNPSGIYMSTNQGNNWLEKNTGISSKNFGIIRGSSNNNILVSSGNGAVYRTTNKGTSWSNISSAFNTATSVLWTDTLEIIVGNKRGIYKSTNGGMSWNVIDTTQVFNPTKAFRAGKDLYVIAGAIFKISNTFTTNISSDIEPVQVFRIGQNYPNPFNPATTINFDLTNQTNVQLVIYDELGREIRPLLNESKNEGAHSVNWDGRDNAGVPVASGTYFYSLITNGKQETRKMLLMK
ncbi:MAG: FlgD immunoglobulin-like domain containing protein, partial [Bacteroidia bacterium]